MRRALLLTLVIAGCEQPRPEHAGIGPYHVGKLTLAKAPGRCEPTDLPDGRKGTWCFANPPLGVAGMNADVDLYFGGTDPASKVIEIQLQIRGCKEQPLDAWLRKSFGVPAEERGPLMAWQNRSVFIIAQVPAAPGRCLVHVLPRSEAAEAERIKAQT